MKVLQKINVSLALLFLSILLIAGQAQALTIDPDIIDLGGLDLLEGECILADSGPDAEADCFNSIDGIDGITTDMLVQIEFSDDPEAAGEISTVDDQVSTTIAIAIDSDTEYFLIKTGNLITTDINAYVYFNEDALDWAYIDLADTLILEISKISHLTQVVPVPAAAWLFGSAMLGLVGVARRRA